MRVGLLKWGSNFQNWGTTLVHTDRAWPILPAFVGSPLRRCRGDGFNAPWWRPISPRRRSPRCRSKATDNGARRRAAGQHHGEGFDAPRRGARPPAPCPARRCLPVRSRPRIAHAMARARRVRGRAAGQHGEGFNAPWGRSISPRRRSTRRRSKAADSGARGPSRRPPRRQGCRPAPTARINPAGRPRPRRLLSKNAAADADMVCRLFMTRS